jgi:hypothetical protein
LTDLIPTNTTEGGDMPSGYTDCACRDCFDIAVSSDMSRPELCLLCKDAGCAANDGECQRADAYGDENEPKAES